MKSNLIIGSQNIQGGARAKLSHDDLVSKICSHDIFCVQESWLDQSACFIDIPGYNVYRSLRKKGRKLEKKHVFGGSVEIPRYAGALPSQACPPALHK